MLGVLLWSCVCAMIVSLSLLPVILWHVHSIEAVPDITVGRPAFYSCMVMVLLALKFDIMQSGVDTLYRTFHADCMQLHVIACCMHAHDMSQQAHPPFEQAYPC